MNNFLRYQSVLGKAIFALTVLLLMSSPVSAQDRGEYASLTEAEQWTVVNGALATGIANGATSLSEAEALRQSVLSVEIATELPSQTRGGKAYIYDYTTDTLNVVLVDLVTGQAVSTESYIGVQLPLTPEEMDLAIQIGIGNDEILQQTEVAYQEITGEPFSQLDQLKLESQIFLATSAPSLVNMQSADCGIRRCAILSIQTRGGELIPVQPIVDLSTQRVIQNVTDPLALVAQPGNLGFVDTGQIVDESTSLPLPSGGIAGTEMSNTFSVESTSLTGGDSTIQLSNDVRGQTSAAPSQQGGQSIDETIVASIEPIGTPGSAKADIFIPFVARRNFKMAQGDELSSQDIFVLWWCALVQNSSLANEIDHLCSY